MRFFVLVMLSILSVSLSKHCKSDEELVINQEIINGVSLENPHTQIDSADMKPLKGLNAGWVAVIPYGFCRQGESVVHYNHAGQWWGEKEEGTRDMIRLAHAEGIKVMLKPHIWMHGAWIGEYDLPSDSLWQVWEESYRMFIYDFAKIAAEEKAEMLCIGTELRKAVYKRPDFWKQLISDIREIYPGKLTYAANWDDYEHVSFWKSLDFVGVNAYFPLTNMPEPDKKEISAGWEPLKSRLSDFSQTYGRQILFTECGYQSVNGAAGNHWEVQMRPENVNFGLQSDCYDVLFEEVWNEPWFAGGFIWKWHFGTHKGRDSELSFTPQDKPALAVITKCFAKYRYQ